MVEPNTVQSLRERVPEGWTMEESSRAEHWYEFRCDAKFVHDSGIVVEVEPSGEGVSGNHLWLVTDNREVAGDEYARCGRDFSTFIRLQDVMRLLERLGEAADD